MCSLPHILRGLEAACGPKAAPLQRDPRRPWLSTHPWLNACLARMWKRHKRAWQKVKAGSNLHNCLNFECITLTYTQIHQRRVEALLAQKVWAGASLVAQWLGVRLPTQGTRV